MLTPRTSDRKPLMIGTVDWSLILANLCFIWYVIVWTVCSLGCLQLYRFYSRRPRAPVSSSLEEPPLITIIRPIKGTEAHLRACLASSLTQNYPSSRLTVFFCIESRDDASLPILKDLIQEHREIDARIVTENDDPMLNENGGKGVTSGLQSSRLGPNPKVRNMSQAYRLGRGDIIWILDSNIWVGPGTAGRMVDKLCGSSQDPISRGKSSLPYKFVHLLPLAVDTSAASSEDESRTPFSGASLEELFLSSSHAKFYTAINTVLLAPCAVGKSTMFRRSHLNALTPATKRAPGLDYFSDYICEDHLVGDLLWKNTVPGEASGSSLRSQAVSSDKVIFGKHALVFGDLAIQPVSQMTVKEYIARRVRWLRVRKYTVILATLVEPGTESILCSLYGAYGFATLAPLMSTYLNDFTTRHAAGWLVLFVLFFMFSMTAWSAVDWRIYQLLHSGKSVECVKDTPSFARGRGQPGGKKTKLWREWIVAWIGREMLAFPVWLWAVWGGSEVSWRGRRFRVGMDMRVTEIIHANYQEQHNVHSKIH